MLRSWNAKIINNSLCLHGNMVFRNSSKKGHKGRLRRSLERFGHLLICAHLQPIKDPPPLVPSIPELSQSPGREFDPTSGKISSCRVSFTDYQITIASRDDARSDWVIEIARWYKLGECRSPHDLEWRNLVCRYDYRPVRRHVITIRLVVPAARERVVCGHRGARELTIDREPYLLNYILLNSITQVQRARTLNHIILP